jgi:hypothetical protein
MCSKSSADTQRTWRVKRTSLPTLSAGNPVVTENRPWAQRESAARIAVVSESHAVVLGKRRWNWGERQISWRVGFKSHYPTHVARIFNCINNDRGAFFALVQNRSRTYKRQPIGRRRGDCKETDTNTRPFATPNLSIAISELLPDPICLLSRYQVSMPDATRCYRLIGGGHHCEKKRSHLRTAPAIVQRRSILIRRIIGRKWKVPRPMPMELNSG